MIATCCFGCPQELNTMKMLVLEFEFVILFLINIFVLALVVFFKLKMDFKMFCNTFPLLMDKFFKISCSLIILMSMVMIFSFYYFENFNDLNSIFLVSLFGCLFLNSCFLIKKINIFLRKRVNDEI